MSNSDTPKDGDFAHWVEEKSEALKFKLGETFPVPPTILVSPTVHAETGRQKLEEVLLEHEEPTQEFLDELAALEAAPPLSDEELARQALAVGVAATATRQHRNKRSVAREAGLSSFQLGPQRPPRGSVGVISSTIGT